MSQKEKKRKLSDDFVVDDEGSGSEGEEEYSEKPKKKTEKLKSPENEKKTLKNADGDNYWNLGGMKRVTARKWKNMKLLDLREFYKDKETGDDKPGKKGISLTSEQWKTLKELSNDIDKALEKM
jgi:hypothetical protein